MYHCSVHTQTINVSESTTISIGRTVEEKINIEDKKTKVVTGINAVINKDSLKIVFCFFSMVV